MLTAVSTRARRLRRCVGAVCVLCCVLSAAWGDDQTGDELRRTDWRPKDGAPRAVLAMTQSSDGYLWLGASDGLYRFDGLRFEHVTVPRDDRLSSAYVSSLFAPPSGGVWIGFTLGGVAFLKDGKLTAYSERDGLPPGTLISIAQDRSGTIWVGTTSGLARLVGSRWQTTSMTNDGSEVRIFALLVDSAGTLWALTKQKTLFLPEGEEVFRESGIHLRSSNDGAGLAESPTGEVWAANDHRLIRLATNENPKRRTATSGLGILFDRKGSLWFTTEKDVRRVAHLERLEPDTSWAEANGTSGDDPSAGPAGFPLIEDREGNVWFGGLSGIGRLSERRVKPALEGAHPSFIATTAAIVTDRAGDPWIGGRGFETFVLKDGRAIQHDEVGSVTCSIRTDDGSLWFGNGDGLIKWTAGHVQRVALPADAVGYGVQAMAQDRAKNLWISIGRKGVFLLKDGTWKPYGDIARLPRLTAVTLATDAAGRVWFGYTEGRVAVVDGNDVEVFSEDNRLSVGNVTAIYARRARVWIGGELGLAVGDGIHFSPVSSDVGTALSSITGIIETDDGDLWVNSRAGIVHFTAAEARRMAADASHVGQSEIFDARDGIEGTSARLRPLPSAVEGSDGRLWFLTDADLYTIHPANVHRNRLPPPVTIESIRVGDRSYPAAQTVTLAKGTTSVQIRYVGLSLTMAEKVRYRYKLESVDPQWQDVQGRRDALYTDLRPGSYRFHVTAANNDGVWSDAGASIDLVIPPTFTQTGWFVALCGAAIVLLVWLAVRLRVRQVAARMRGRFTERMAERERIARELHDTLLQSTQGLILRFQAVANQIAPDDPSREMLDDALKRADVVMAEGRDRVLDLRVPTDRVADLVEAFAATGKELAEHRPVTFRCVVDGEPRDLVSVVRHEVYCIGREALLNAFRHAEAHSIEMEVTFANERLRVRVRDDGIGIDERTVELGARPDHWGLQGMRERAEKIGAHLELWSKVGAGTEIEISVPAGSAYRAPLPRSRWLLLHRLRKVVQ